jgi:acetyltransferase-like isoleucine patch superfamily enzyme
VRLGDRGRLGRNVFVGLFSYVNGDVVLEDDVLIGPHCCLTSNTHLFNPSSGSFRGKNVNHPITIGRGSWLAAGAMVTAGTTVGKCNLICANAVVTKDTADYAIVRTLVT